MTTNPKPEEAARTAEDMAHLLEAALAELEGFRREFNDFRRRVAAAGDVLAAIDPDRVRENSD